MPQNLKEQNDIDAGRFENDFTSMHDDAQADSAVEFMRGFSDGADTAAATPVQKADTPQSSDPVQDAALGVGRDIGLGVIHSPRSVARGATKGVNSMLDFMKGVTDFVPTLTMLDEQAKATNIPRVVTSGEQERRFNLERTSEGKEPIKPLRLPVPDKPKTDTVTGSLIEGITQFAVGFKGVDKIGKVLGTAGEATGLAKAGIATLKGAAADLLAFDQHEQRLSNVIQQVPALQNPVTEYLQAKPDDGFVEGKLKQAIEGVVTSGAGEALFGGIKLLKKGLAAKSAAEADGLKPQDIFDNLPPEDAAGVGVDRGHFEFLGRADDPELILQKSKDAKLAAAADETAAAFGKTKRISPESSPTINDFEINFARINGPDDIKALMDEMVNHPALKPSIEGSRRGKITNADTLTAATDIDGFDSLMARRTGEAFNAEHIVAGRRIYYDTTTKLMEAAKRAAGPDASAVDQFNFRKMIATHHAVQKEFMGIRAEAGRALQAWSIPVGGSGSENLKALEQTLTEFGGTDASVDLARRLTALGNNLNTTQINSITQRAAVARTVDAVAEAWTLGLLTNPTTHVVNLSSNILTGLMLGGERYAAALSKDSPVSFKEGTQYFVGMMESQKLAIKNMAQAFRTGESGIGLGKIEQARTRKSARDILDPEGKAGVLSKAIDWYGGMLNKYVGNALGAADEYSKTVLYQAQLRALATRQGIAKGLEGAALSKHIADALDAPTAKMRADAVTFAQYGTFTRELGKAGQKTQQIIHAFPALRFVAPFVRTPANIFKFTFERTPLAPLSQAVRDDIAAGGLRKNMALTKIGVGTSIMAIGADLSMNGHISGAGPNNSDARAALRRTGWKPYSIKVGDTWHSYARFEPVATILGLSADMAEIMSNYESYDVDAQTDVDGLVTAAVIAGGNQVVGKTFMTGFADLTEMLSDPERYAKGFLQKFAGSFVPAGVAALERAGSPEMEQVFNMKDAVLSRIPGASEFVGKKRDIWGDEIKWFTPGESMAGNAASRVWSLVNPMSSSTEQDAPVDRWMLKNGFDIPMPQKTQVFGDVRLDLREYPKAYERLVVLRGHELKLDRYGGQSMKQFFENLATENDPFGRHVGFFMGIGNSYEDQQNFISGVVRDYTAAARLQILQEFPGLPAAISQEQRNAAAVNRVRSSIRGQGQ
jgi:hypothetical protein